MIDRTGSARGGSEKEHGGTHEYRAAFGDSSEFNRLCYILSCNLHYW